MLKNKVTFMKPVDILILYTLNIPDKVTSIRKLSEIENFSYNVQLL